MNNLLYLIIIICFRIKIILIRIFSKFKTNIKSKYIFNLTFFTLVTLSLLKNVILNLQDPEFCNIENWEFFVLIVTFEIYLQIKTKINREIRYK